MNPHNFAQKLGVKSDLRIGNDSPLLRTGSVYIRSLNANNTPSSTIATWKDWPTIVEVCFDNREADIGRFLRRHLGSVTPEVVREFLATVLRGNEPEATTEELLQQYLQEGEERFQAVARERRATLPEHGAWEVALLFVGQIPQHAANRGFLQIPPDFVVKSQAIDIAEVILALIRQPNVVSTLWRNRQSRRERLSTSEAHGSTTKSDGMCFFTSWC